jgi:hypothetical protein
MSTTSKVTTGGAAASVDLFLLVDRVVTATTVNAVVQALLGIQEALRSSTEEDGDDGFILEPAPVSVSSNQAKAKAEEEEDEEEDNPTLQLYNVLTDILRGVHPAVKSATQRDEVWQAVLKIYIWIAKKQSKQQQQHHAKYYPLRLYYMGWLANPHWIPALVDICTPPTSADNHADADADHPLYYAGSYTRVLAIETIVRAAQLVPTATQQALLQTPQALHRLAELIMDSPTTAVVVDEQVQITMLQQLAPIIASWPATAKIWVFHEVPQYLLRMCCVVHDNDIALGTPVSGWTGGTNIMVQDGIPLITQLLSHDATSVQLVTQSDTQFWNLLAQLLDLRQGQEFINPSLIVKRKEKQQQQNNDNKKSSSTKSKKTKDDLDDLLLGTTTTTVTNDKETGATVKADTDENDAMSIMVPRLTPAEESVLQNVLHLLRTVLVHDSVRSTASLTFWRYLWDWACLGPPPPSLSTNQAPCAWSSATLQAQVLQVLADYGGTQGGKLLFDPAWHVWDRLLYLACTGGPGVTDTERTQISQGAVAVLRACLEASPDLIQECLLLALAPPPQSPADEPGIDGTTTSTNEKESTALKASAVPRLLQTVVEHLQTADVSDNVHVVGLSGALSALGLIAGHNEAQKSMLLKLSTSTVLHDMWERLAVELERQSKLQEKTSEEDVATLHHSKTLVLAILRLVGTWMADAPLVVQAWLQDAESVAIMGALLRTNKDKPAHRFTDTVPIVASLILGVALVNLPKNDDCGGWTSDTIVDVLGNLTSRMTSWSQWDHDDNEQESTMPWTANASEKQAWKVWYDDQVLHVRKALIRFVAGNPNDGDDDDDDTDDRNGGGDVHGKGPSRKSLQSLLAQQAKEVEELRQRLKESQLTVTSQGMS